MDSPMASSVRYLQIPLETPEEEHQRWNGQTLFIAQDEELTSVHQSAMKHENDHIHVDGRMNSHAIFNSENMDHRLEAASIALLGQSAAGLTRARAGKRKSRVSSKVPIRVFSADAANFMAMVHKLTGFQSRTCLFSSTPQNPLLKPLPSRALHPGMQGVLIPEFSAFPTSNLTADNSANAVFHSNLLLDQRAKPGSRNGSPAINKSANIQGETSKALLSSLWQPMEEHIRKNESCTDLRIEKELPHDNVCKQGRWEGL